MILIQTQPSHMLTPQFPWTDAEIDAHVRKAVSEYWTHRTGAADKQKSEGRLLDYGARSEVTAGKHLDAILKLFCDLIEHAGFRKDEIKFQTGVELPGFYRATKKWDIVVVRKTRLCAAIELKSQVGPSFGNNFNNRVEEALGNSLDLWRAYEAGTLGIHQPWVGYCFFYEDAKGSTTPVRLAATTPFMIEEVFKKTSYADRYAILCKRMVLDRRYNSATMLMSERGSAGDYRQMPELEITSFMKALFGHLIGCAE